GGGRRSRPAGILQRAHVRAEEDRGEGGGGAQAGAAAGPRLAHHPRRREHHHGQARQLPQPEELVGGLDCTVHRNFFGSQLQSFETELSVPMLADKEGGSNTCRGVFIRAPAILEVGSDVEILAECPVPSGRPSITIPSAEGVEEEVYSKDRVIVAVRQGSILATAFHPELTSDCRWHRFFLDMDKESHPKAFSALSLSSSSRGSEGGSKTKPFDLPIFE
ncbi:hypothetical protein CFC21_050909, partial [Triticum aestivum]